MNKKGFGFDLAKDLLILAVVTAFLIVLATQTLTAVDSQSKVGICGVSAVVTDLSGQLSEGTAKPKWRCPIDGPIEITASDLSSNPASWLPEQTKAKYSTTDELKMDVLTNNPDIKAEYNLNKIVSGKIRDCYLKTGFSRAELFSNWYAFMGQVDASEFSSGAFEDFKPSNYKFNYPVGCGICSTLYLDQKAQELLGKNKNYITNLDEYMFSHPQSPTSTESLLDYTELRGDGIFSPDLRYYTGGIEDPMYVVIQRHEIHQALLWKEDIEGAFTWGLNLIPGVEVTNDNTLEAFVTFRVLKGSDLNTQCAFIGNEFEE